jgi:glutamyl-tRNA reductase
VIQLVGVRHNVKLEVREKLSIIPKRSEEALKRILVFCSEAVIISTCNRTEVYFNSDIVRDEAIERLFDALDWDKNYKGHAFYLKEKEAVEHLMYMVCGFDSILLGEDQILGQVKNSYDLSLKSNGVKNELQRLFQTAITCGKEFRFKAGLSSIPVSSASIVVREARKRKLKRFMILGYGEVGSLTAKYVLDDSFDVLYIAVRDINSVAIKDQRVKVIPFKDRKKYYEDVECIISCTSAPHSVINSEDLPNKNLLIFDLAVPRDVHENVRSMKNVEVYDIDNITEVNDENYQKRKKIMEENRYIVESYVEEFLEWQKLKNLTPYILQIKNAGDSIYKSRFITFKNKMKTKDNEKLAEMLLKSTSNAYVNRAIEILKEEHLKGRGEECLRIIQRIFQPER